MEVLEDQKECKMPSWSLALPGEAPGNQ